MELARLRLRGGYGVAAAILLLVLAPAYQSVVFGSDYLNAIQAIAGRHDFGPYLVWISQNTAADWLSRVLQLVGYALAATLPGPLVKALWPPTQTDPRADSKARWSSLPALLAGWAGFGLFALTLVVGALTSVNSASAYVAANATQRGAIASQFAGIYALETIFSRVIGGFLVAIFLGMVCARMASTRALPRWLAYLGALVVILISANALLFAFAPTQVGTFVSTPAIAGLALWLAGLGILLARVRSLPLVTPQEASEETTETTGDT